MATTWYKTDTPADNSGEMCYAPSATATNPFWIECSTDSGDIGSGTDTPTMPAKQSYVVGAYESPSGIGVSSIPAGTWTININVTVAAASGSYFDRVDICEITPGGSPVKTIGSATGLSVDIGTTGNKQLQVTLGSPVSVTSTNHWYIEIGAYCNAHAGTSFTIDRTLTIVDTITLPTPVQVDCTTEAVTVSELGASVALTQRVNCTTEAVVITKFNASINVEKKVTTTTDTVTCTGLNGAIQQDMVVGCGTATTTVTGYDVQLPIKVAPAAPGAVVVTEYSASVSAETLVACGVDAVTCSTLQADVEVPTGVEVECTVAPVTVSDLNGTVNARTQVDATTDAVTVSTLGATVTCHELTQSSFRWRYNDGDETGATWRAAVNDNPANIYTTVNYRVRFLIQETGGEDGVASATFRPEFRRNGGAWNVFQGWPTYGGLGQLVADDDCTQQLGAGSFVSDNNGQQEGGDGQSFTVTPAIQAGYEFECEFTFHLAFTGWINGDTLELRVTRGDGTVIAGYTNTPSVTVSQPGYARFDFDHFRFRYDDDDEVNASWIKPVDTDAILSAGVTYRIRASVLERYSEDVELGEQAGFNLAYNLNSGGWNDITTTSNVVRAVASQLTDGGDTTQQISVGNFEGNNDGQTDGRYTTFPIDNTWTGGDYIECEWGIQIQDVDVSPGDVIQIGRPRFTCASSHVLATQYQTLTVGVLANVAAPIAVTGLTADIPWAVQVDCSAPPQVYLFKHDATVTCHALEQVSYLWRKDDGTEVTATDAASQDNDPALILPDVTYRLRFLLEETGGKVGVSGTEYALYYRINAGSWKPLAGPGGGQEILWGRSALTDNGDTTQQIGSGSFMSDNDGQVWKHTWVTPNAIGAGEEVEVEFSFVCGYGELSDGDLIDFEVRRGDGSRLNTYTNEVTSVEIDVPAYKRWKCIGWRWRNDDGTEATASWKRGTNEPIDIPLDTTIRVRWAFQEMYGMWESGNGTGGDSAGQYGIRWVYNDGAQEGWVYPATTTYCKMVLSQLVQGDNCIQRITSGGNFVDDNKAQWESTNDRYFNVHVEGDYPITEAEVSVQILSTEVSQGDKLHLYLNFESNESQWRGVMDTDVDWPWTIIGASFATTGAVTVTALAATVASILTVDCTTDTVTCSTYQATIPQQAQPVTVDCTLATVTVSDLTGTVNAEVLVSATSTVALSATTEGALLSTDVAFTTTLGEVTVTPYDATVALGLFVDCTVDTVTVSALGSTVLAGTGVAATLGTVTVDTFGAMVPTIVGTGIDTVTVSPLNATLEVEVTVQTVQGYVTLTSLAAGVHAETVVIASTDSVLLAALPAFLATGTIVPCTTVAATVSAPSASINVETVVTCSVDVVTVSALTSSVTAGQEVSCTVASVTASALDATVAVGNDVVCDTTPQVTLTSLTSTLTTNVQVSTTVASVTVAEYGAAITIEAHADCNTGAVTVAALGADVLIPTVVDATLGTVTVAAATSTIEHEQLVTTTLGPVTVTSYGTFIQVDQFLPTTTAGVTVSTSPANVGGEVDVACSVGTVTVTPYDAVITFLQRVNATTVPITVTGYGPAITYDLVITFNVGQVTVTALAAILERFAARGESIDVTSDWQTIKTETSDWGTSFAATPLEDS